MRKIWLIIVLCALAPMSSQADVADSAPDGFTIKVANVIHAGPDAIYNRLVHNIGDWWSPEHTFSGDAHNLSIDDKAMGCFCEKLPNGGGARYAEIIMVMPGKMLVLSGALGPLQRLAVTGTLSFVILPMHDSSRLEVTYSVGGYLPGGLNVWAAPVDKALTEQVNRLKSYVETGSPVAAGTAVKQP